MSTDEIALETNSSMLRPHTITNYRKRGHTKWFSEERRGAVYGWQLPFHEISPGGVVRYPGAELQRSFPIFTRAPLVMLMSTAASSRNTLSWTRA